MPQAVYRQTHRQLISTILESLGHKRPVNNLMTSRAAHFLNHQTIHHDIKESCRFSTLVSAHDQSCKENQYPFFKIPDNTPKKFIQ